MKKTNLKMFMFALIASLALSGCAVHNHRPSRHDRDHHDQDDHHKDDHY